MDRGQKAIAEAIGLGSNNIDFRGGMLIKHGEDKTIMKTDVKCPRCKQSTWKRIDRVLTSDPPQYQYECLNPDCGWIGWFTF